MGTSAFADGSTPTGANGPVVDSLACATLTRTETTPFTYTHVNLVVDGKIVSIPQGIGFIRDGATGTADRASTGCAYPLVTTDNSGKIRAQNGASASYTLGQFFKLWGQPLSATNVAGYANKPVKIFVRDDASLAVYTGAPDTVPLTANREITIQVGSSLSEIPRYEWTNPPPLASTVTPVTQGEFNVAKNGAFGLSDNRATATGEPIDGLSCYGPRTNTLIDETYHGHTLLAIYKDGARIALPQEIGIVGNYDAGIDYCLYPVHSHDLTGVIHHEAASNASLTLGQFFDIWRMPLTRSNVAGLQGPVVVYINDGGNLRTYQGDLSAIELRAYRNIVIQIGTPLTTVPAYELAAPL